ncbi:hypothetical protein [uncultured Desulfovibrio sp.]|uniref:hypothetical protein n=1 Tax=uncultured Desulfovibrio sp. TaxID=167968 RepID=UPI00262B1396|nr:hypothetical protein [uncultured Desulfovibrio sp.]
MSASHRIVGGICTGPASPGEDGLTVYGPGGAVEIVGRVFDFRGVPAADQDEVISGVDGSVVRLRGCVILGGIKAMLAGNGDHPVADAAGAHWELSDCAIIGSGRRCPEAQDGVTVTMRRCWVHDWGRAFDVRAFGAWAHRGGRIMAEDCLFTQSAGLLGLGLGNTLRDVANHIGQAVNDYGLSALLRPRTYLPGVCRGLTADTGGLALATRCYRNRRWIRVEGCNDFASYGRALDMVVLHMEPACPDMREILGMSLSEYFCSVI